ncbi:MAG TPA: adenylate/guanylate cyclase domain-containing protein, partial [Nitrosospira sp.]
MSNIHIDAIMDPGEIPSHLQANSKFQIRIRSTPEMVIDIQLPSGTLTFLFSDIEGSIKLAQQYPDEMPGLLARHRQILQEAMERNHGVVFQGTADSFSVAFHSAHDALSAAVEAQRALYNEPWSPAPIRVRMGIHTGTVRQQTGSKMVERSNYTALAATQRIMDAGHGGQILLSSATREL